MNPEQSVPLTSEIMATLLRSPPHKWLKHKHIQSGNLADKHGLPYVTLSIFMRRMKSRQYKAGAHLSEVISDERQLILHSSKN